MIEIICRTISFFGQEKVRSSVKEMLCCEGFAPDKKIAVESKEPLHSPDIRYR